MIKLFYDIVKVAKKESGNNLHTINDLFYVCKNTIDEGNVKEGLHLCKELKKLLGQFIKNETNKHKEELYNKIFDVLVLESRYSFDSYFQALEFNRPVKEQFYLPRRNTLIKHGVIQALEDLLINDKIDELFLSMPPRVGKTTLSLFVISWIIGFDSEKSNLYCSNSSGVTDPFYEGVLSILSDEYTYNWKKIFPNVKFDPLSMCNAKKTQLDTGRKKRYHSFTARSIDGALNGACDCNGLLIADDLVTGIQEAMSIDRLRGLWLKVSADMLTRAKERAKILWIGTRWSVIDPAGIRQDLLINDETFRDYKWRSINIPALNDLDESNFDYKYGVGFDTKYYKERRASFERNNDLVSWACQFQGVPYEREGTVFAPDDLMFYNGTLPDKDPDRVFMAVDPAWGGGDFCAAPIVYQYGTELYMADVVYDNSDKSKTIPKIARKVREHGVNAMYIEASKTTHAFAEELDKLIKSEGRRVNIQTSMKNAIGKNKNDRILAASPEIREHFVFLESGKRTKEYEQFMQNVYSFKILGKNKHDDAPDSLQMAITFAFPAHDNRITVSRRYF